MSDESNRLLQLFDLRASSSQAQFGIEFEIGSGSMVWQYLHGRRKLHLSAGVKFARGLKVDLKDFSPRLATELEQMTGARSHDVALTEYAQIPCVSLEVSKSTARFQASPIGPTPVFIAFRRAWLESKGLASTALMAAACSDEGMRPTLAQGDLVVINTADTRFEDAAVYAFSYEGQFVIRRLFRDEGLWWLTCDNRSSHRFMRKHFSDKHCFILGRIVHRQSEVL